MKKIFTTLSLTLILLLGARTASQAQTSFVSLGADNSASPGYKTMSTNPNIQVSNVMVNDGSDMYYGSSSTGEGYTVGPFSIKAKGVTDFTFNGMNFRGYIEVPVDAAHSKIIFKNASGATIQTMTLNSNKNLTTSSTSMVSFFDNGTTVPIYNVAEIIIEVYYNSTQANQQNSANFNFVDITTSASPVLVAPTVTTQAVSSIATTTATGNGNITALGVPNLTSYGVCWNTTGNPTISDSKVDKGAASVTGAFTAFMPTLSANTTYYVRAFATNTAGTSYGTQVSFTTTQPVSTPSGTGTLGDPYLISNLAELYWVAEQVNAVTDYSNVFVGKYFKQTADIDASSTSTWFPNGSGGYYGWTPIGYDNGTNSAYFGGTYDGQGHTISGLYINRLHTNYVGLWGVVYSGTVKNLGLINVAITAGGAADGDYCGALAGYLYSGAVIDNCYSTGSVTGYDEVGGLVGEDFGDDGANSITNSHSSCAITVANGQGGGLIGRSSSSTISN